MEEQKMPDQKPGKEKLQSKGIGPVWAVLLGMMLGTTVSIFIRYGNAPALVLAAYRKTMAAVMMLPVVLLFYRKELKAIRPATLLWCLLAGAFLAAHFVTYFLSVRYTTVTASNVLAGTEVLFVSAFLFLTGKEKYSRKSLAGIAIALAGGVLVSITYGDSPALNGPFGNFCGVACAALLAAYTLIGTHVRRTDDLSNTVFTFIAYSASALVLNIMVALSGYSFTGYGVNNYISAFGMAVFGTFCCHSIYTWSVKYISPTLLAILKILAPIPTALVALVILGEVPTWNQIAGGLVVIAGIILYILGTEEGA